MTQVPFRHNETGCMPEKLSHGPQITLQGKAGNLVAVMDDGERPDTHATLLKSPKHCHSLFRALQDHDKAIWKSYPVAVSG